MTSITDSEFDDLLRNFTDSSVRLETRDAYGTCRTALRGEVGGRRARRPALAPCTPTTHANSSVQQSYPNRDSKRGDSQSVASETGYCRKALPLRCGHIAQNDAPGPAIHQFD